jgi:predicted enzyme related to lactoylglutathione lyase
MIDARFGHLNLIARDWRSLADWYTRVFGCEFVPPERDYSGPDLEAGTSVPGAALQGAHLRLPGHGGTGPTLEIYQFGSMPDEAPSAANRPGFRHIAFVVPSVVAARELVLAGGGAVVGSVVTLHTADGRFVTWAYVTDPEGNIIELQSWSDEPPVTGMTMTLSGGSSAALSARMADRESRLQPWKEAGAAARARRFRRVSATRRIT